MSALRRQGRTTAVRLYLRDGETAFSRYEAGSVFSFANDENIRRGWERVDPASTGRRWNHAPVMDWSYAQTAPGREPSKA